MSPQPSEIVRHDPYLRFAPVALLALLAAATGASAAPPHFPPLHGMEVDATAVPGAGDVVTVRRGDNRCVLVSRRDFDMVDAYRLNLDGTFGPKTGGVAVGDAPLKMARVRGEQYVAVVNSGSHDLSILGVDADCVPSEAHRAPSGGFAPFDVASAFDDQLVVVNRDSDSINAFFVNGNAVLAPSDSAPAGVDPHIVAISPQGLVAVGNSASNDLSVVTLNRAGQLVPVQRAGLDVFGNAEQFLAPGPRNRHFYERTIRPLLETAHSPRAIAIADDGSRMFVAASSGAAGDDNRILAYHLNKGGYELQSVVLGGLFVTDLCAHGDTLHAATVNRNGHDEIRAYWHHGDTLVPATRVSHPGSPSFKSLEGTSMAAPHAAGATHLLVTEFQGGQLRLLEF